MKLNFDNINVVFIPIRINEKGLCGFCNLTIDDRLALNGIAVYTKPNGDGFRLVYPLNKSRLEEIFYFTPITKDFGDILTNAVNDKITDLLINKKEQ